MSTLPPAPRDHRAKAPSRVQVAEEMFRTLNEMAVKVAFETSRTASLQALGPFAQLMDEFIARQSALEDAFWYCPECRVVQMFVAPSDLHVCHDCTASVEGGPVFLVQYAYVPKAKPASDAPVVSPEAGGDAETAASITPAPSDAPPAPAEASAVPPAALDTSFESTAP